MHMRLSSVCVIAHDFPRLTEWYREVLGLELTPPSSVVSEESILFRPDKFRTIHMGLRGAGEQGLEFFRAAEHEVRAQPPLPPRENGIFLGFHVEDLDAKLADLKSKGATIVSEPEIVEHYWGRFFWVADPEGNHVEIGQPYTYDWAEHQDVIDDRVVFE